MFTYSSKPIVVKMPADELNKKFSDFTIFKDRLSQLTPEQREQLGETDFTTDTMEVNTPQMGRVTLRAVERTSDTLALQAEGTPMPLLLKVVYKPVDANSTEITGAVDADLPLMLKPMVGPLLQKFANKLGDLFASLA